MTDPAYHRDVDRRTDEDNGPQLPPELGALLEPGHPPPSTEHPKNQAFPLVTVGPSGHPHVLLLSHRQLELSRSGGTLLVSVHGRRTRSNLRENRRATLIAVEGESAHYLKCTLVRAIDRDDRGGLELRIDEHERDTAGVELGPLTFHFSPELEANERWDLDEAVLAALR